MAAKWGSWFRRNFDKLLLLALVVILLTMVTGITLASASPDLVRENVHWLREQAGTVIGALLGAIGGYSVASAKFRKRNPGEDGPTNA